ncbi:MAG: hypothetical protein K0M66_11000 [Thiobacillus sp.]|nr:hypothetical protein [Thiobacillus sp.]
MTMLVAGLPRVTLTNFLRIEDPYEWLAPVIEGITRLKEELITPAAYRNFIESHAAPDHELQRKRLDVATTIALAATSRPSALRRRAEAYRCRF